MKAIKDIFTSVVSIAPLIRTTSVNGSGVDLANVLENVIFVQCGALTDGTHTPKIQESADNSSFTDVAAADLVGSLSALTANTTQKVSYIGSKRYIRAVNTVTGSPSTGANVVANVVVKYRK